MKNVFIIACFGLLFSSCATDYNATPENTDKGEVRNDFQGDFRAIIDTVDYLAELKYYTDNTVEGIRSITVSGVMQSKKRDPETFQNITLMISNFEGPGIYPIDGLTTATYLNSVEGEKYLYIAKQEMEENTITITDVDSKIEGSFNFTVEGGEEGQNRLLDIKGGSFSIPR